MFNCTTYEKPLSFIIQQYNDSKIIKASQQRKKKWIDKPNISGKCNNQDFIKFSLYGRHIGLPLLIAKKNNKLIIIDGNNRLNALISFYKQPLRYLPELQNYIKSNQYIPNDFLTELYKIPYNEWKTKHIIEAYFKFITGSRSAVPRINSNSKPWPKWYTDIENEEFLETVHTDFENMIQGLMKKDIDNIKIPITEYDNISTENIATIYASINKSGIKLTKQEILAATMSVFIYDNEEIEHITTLFPLKKYRAEHNAFLNEGDELRTELNNSINLYEILTSFQYYLHDKYKFIPTFSDKAQINFIFKIYDCIHEDAFDKKNENIALFIHTCINIWDFLIPIFNELCIPHSKQIEYKLKDNYIHKIFLDNHLMLLMSYLYANSEKSIDTYPQYSKFKKKIKTLLFNYCLYKIVGEKNCKKHNNKSYDILEQYIWASYNSIGNSMKNITKKCKLILNKTIELNIIPYSILTKIISTIDISCIEEQKSINTRRKPKQSIQFLLSMWFKITTPLMDATSEKELDHIIPISKFKHYKGEQKINSNRLGNYVYVSKNDNQYKKAKRPSDVFLRNNFNTLVYSGEEWDRVFDEQSNVIITNYKLFCDKRENTMLTKIVNYFYK
tara:strand:- start:1566 stop:3413 length:1848 start_codon:yes stop_codon:yes gene_type:complete